MPITVRDRFFGEGIGSYGADSFEEALDQHRQHVRLQRLKDAFSNDEKGLTLGTIAAKFEIIAAAVRAADDQVESDNASLIIKFSKGRG